MDLRLSGINPLSYEGVNASQPPQLILSNGVNARNPSVDDWQGQTLGNLWLNAANENLYVLVGLGVNPITKFRQATWDLIAMGSTGAVTELTGNSGGAVPPSAGNINIVGDGVTVSVAGNPVTHTLTISVMGSGVVEKLTGNTGTATPVAGNINVIAATTEGTARTTGSGDTISLAFSDAQKNTGIGTFSLGVMAPAADENVAYGYGSGTNISTGIGNTLLGFNAAKFLLTGDFNIIIGHNTAIGYNGAESNNISIGGAGSAGESNVIRIGIQGTQTTCFVAGIAGVTLMPLFGSSIVAVDNTTGQLGATTGLISSWVDVTAATQAMAVNTGYTANRATLITFTLPATAAYGSVMRIVGKGTGLYTIAQNAGQSIHFVNNGPISTTVGVGGSLSSIDQYGSIELLCSIADTDFTVLSMNGNFTPV